MNLSVETKTVKMRIISYYTSLTRLSDHFYYMPAISGGILKQRRNNPNDNIHIPNSVKNY